MIAAKLKGKVTADHRLQLTVPSSVPPGEVEVIVLRSEPQKKAAARARKPSPNIHPAAGIWVDRDDIDLNDSAEFAADLCRRLVQNP